MVNNQFNVVTFKKGSQSKCIGLICHWFRGSSPVLVFVCRSKYSRYSLPSMSLLMTTSPHRSSLCSFEEKFCISARPCNILYLYLATNLHWQPDFFGKWTFLILFCLDMPTYPIIHKFNFLWPHYFSPLLCCTLDSLIQVHLIKTCPYFANTLEWCLCLMRLRYELTSS